LQRIELKAYIDIKKEVVQIKFKETFFFYLSKKCSNYPPNYNGNQIKILYEQNESKDVIKIFYKTVIEQFNEYITTLKKKFQK
jgi:hypothetical protein